MNLKNIAVLAMVSLSLAACNQSPNQNHSKSENEISTEKMHS